MVINKKYLSTAEVARVLGVSRIAVLKKIYSGEIEAIRVGRNYAIDSERMGLSDRELSDEKKKTIKDAVSRVFREYGEAIRRLGKE